MLRLLFVCLGIVIITGSLVPQPAIGVNIDVIIDPAFSPQERVVINEAVRQWTAVSYGGYVQHVEVVKDNGISDRTNGRALGETTNIVFDPDTGRPVQATILVDAQELNWTLGKPDPQAYDALTLVNHELGHALGFTVQGDGFFTNVINPDAPVFDVNGNLTPDCCDLPLVMGRGVDNVPTHAAPGTGNLMEPEIPFGQRREPLTIDGQIIAKAYTGISYPEPSTISLFTTGVVILIVAAAMKSHRSTSKAGL
jgi:hypothetical protein